MSESVYSHNGDDDWTEDFDEVRHRATEFLEVGDSHFTYYEGPQRPFTHADFVSGSQIIERFQEQAYDEVHEHSDDYLSELGRDEINELESLIVEFLKKNAQQPTFYAIDGVVKKTEPLTADELKKIQDNGQ